MVLPTGPSHGAADPTWLLFGIGLGGAALAVALAAWLVARRSGRAGATERGRPTAEGPGSPRTREPR